MVHGVSADAQAYFGPRRGLATGRAHDVVGGSGRWCAAAQSYWAVSRVGSAAGWRELAAVHLVIVGLPRDRCGGSAGDGIERHVAETAQEVVATFQELACDRDARAVPAHPLGGGELVLAVGAARAPRRLGGFIERPAQRGWPLAGEMARGTAGIGLVDGDVQA